MKLTPKQITMVGFVAAALGLSAYLVFRPDPSQPRLKGTLDFVCVRTGQRFELDRDSPDCKFIPARNPVSNERTLLPCSKTDDKWFVIDHYREAVVRFAGDNYYVDPQTLEVKPAP